MQLSLLQEALAAAETGRSAALATNLKSGLQVLVQPSGTKGSLTLDHALTAAVNAAVRDDRSGTIETADGSVFIEVFNPPLRCFVVGAVHIAQPLARMAALAGYAVTIIDPRSAFASELRFPGIALSTEWPDDAMAALRPDRRTAIVTLTHDPKIDDPALTSALRSDAFYVGALGSKRAQDRRREALGEDADRINGPVGLDLGAEGPAEIALSIAAELLAAVRKGEAPADAPPRAAVESR